jgi:hypothetical protein
MTKRYNGDSNNIAADKRFKTIDAVSNDLIEVRWPQPQV